MGRHCKQAKYNCYDITTRCSAKCVLKFLGIFKEEVDCRTDHAHNELQAPFRDFYGQLYARTPAVQGTLQAPWTQQSRPLDCSKICANHEQLNTAITPFDCSKICAHLSHCKQSLYESIGINKLQLKQNFQTHFCEVQANRAYAVEANEEKSEKYLARNSVKSRSLGAITRSEANDDKWLHWQWNIPSVLELPACNEQTIRVL